MSVGKAYTYFGAQTFSDFLTLNSCGAEVALLCVKNYQAFMNGDSFHKSFSGDAPPAQDRVLVAVLPRMRDFEIVREKGWYRIPIPAAQEWIGHRWPPQWIAFYHSQSFERDAFSIRYYAKVIGFHEAGRHELFPEESLN